ncbi:MAG TPA: type IV pilus secretin PilQ [Terriglobales bacterium]|nr:type IV pilus secretin PilQ [Terriglobales bacterium]
MRKQFLATIWVLLAITMMAVAQTSGTELTGHAALQKVTVSRGNDGISVEITAKGAVVPKVETLASPARIVVDLPNTKLATSLNRIRVASDGVSGVRIGTDASDTTRVVVDLERLCKYELVSAAGNKLVLKLNTAGSSVAAQSTAKTSIETASLQQPPAMGNGNGVAREFQFVEPAFTPKKATPVEPSVRSAAAASKFVERPEGNLLPGASAAMQSPEQSALQSTSQTVSAQSSTPSTPASTTSSDSSAATPVQASPVQAVQPAPVQPAPVQPAVNLAAEQRSHQQSASAGGKYTGEPISVNLKDVDLKDFFRLIHEISGLNVVLDPDVKGSLTIVLDDVPWDQALDIVLKNNALARQLEGNVLRIATVDTMRREAEARRAAQEAEAMAVEKVTVTRFLSYAHSKDVVTTIKRFLSQRGDIVSDDRTNAIIISDIPSVIPGVDRLIQQLDRKTQEVEIEARVVSATRSFARDIGTQLGFGFGNNATHVGGASAVGTSPTAIFNTPGAMYPVIGTAAPGPGTGIQIPLFSNLGVTGPTSGISFSNASNAVRIDAILTMAESRGLLKILSRPRVVTQNNIQAIVKQGVRIPIESQATLSSPATITYVDAFLKLTVTPQITVENTIFLNVDVENTTPDFSQQINGNPTLITQQATTQVLVTDGGTVVIGGVIQTNNSVNIAQVPLLGSIPWLGNLFKHQTVNSSSQELIFFITPRVIET